MTSAISYSCLHTEKQRRYLCIPTAILSVLYDPSAFYLFTRVKKSDVHVVICCAKMGAVECDIPALILNELNSSGEINSLEYANQKGIDHQKIIGAIKSLESHGNVSQYLLAMCASHNSLVNSHSLT